ncbi:small ubiquitin-related modifier 2 isoform 1-T1 [Morus bassanus]
MADEKPKEGVKTENNDHINLKVAGQDGSVVQFKIKRHTPLSKLMKAYCERQGLSMRQIRFRFDGQPINETDTPAQVKMKAIPRTERFVVTLEYFSALLHVAVFNRPFQVMQFICFSEPLVTK